MGIIQGQTITCESVDINDAAFVACPMIDCVLVHSGHPVSFDRTQLLRCQYVFLGIARATVQLRQNTELMPCDPAQWGEFSGPLN